MDLRELAELAKKMRDAQKSYYKSQSSAALALSKRLERQLDKAVEEVLNPSLFFTTGAGLALIA